MKEMAKPIAQQTAASLDSKHSPAAQGMAVASPRYGIDCIDKMSGPARSTGLFGRRLTESEPGTENHLGSGPGRHIAHEACRVVQPRKQDGARETKRSTGKDGVQPNAIACAAAAPHGLPPRDIAYLHEVGVKHLILDEIVRELLYFTYAPEVQRVRNGQPAGGLTFGQGGTQIDIEGTLPTFFGKEEYGSQVVHELTHAAEARSAVIARGGRRPTDQADLARLTAAGVPPEGREYMTDQLVAAQMQSAKWKNDPYVTKRVGYMLMVMTGSSGGDDASLARDLPTVATELAFYLTAKGAEQDDPLYQQVMDLAYWFSVNRQGRWKAAGASSPQTTSFL